jgi:hypothetical protein
MRLKAVSLALLSITIIPTFAQLPEDLKRKFDEAERRIVRLSPTAFPELPRNVVRELQSRGCTIPQPYTDRRANVIRGEFVKPGQTDWAVLCSTQGSTSLFVFWNGSATNPVELANYPDNPGRIDLFIRSVGRKFIMDHYRAYGGPKPPPIDHQGIESGGETASVRAVLLSWQVADVDRGGLSAGMPIRGISGPLEQSERAECCAIKDRREQL